jgi:hypothetical protein
MPAKATSARLDSQNQAALPLTCSASERPPVIMTNAALEALQDERDAARRAWMRALLTIPAKLGARRTAAVNKCLKLREHYELLCGHPAGKPDEAKA